MRTPLNSALFSNLRLCSRGASLVVALFGCFGLAGWILKVDALTRIFQGLPSMMPNTAFAFVLAGFSLWLRRNATGGNGTRRTAQACALAVTLIGALTLCEYVFHWNAGIDLWLFRESLTLLQTPIPGRPAFLTALNFLLLGLALLLSDEKSRYHGFPTQFLTVTAILISLLALIGYACNVPLFYGWRSLFGDTGMALHTSTAFTVLGAGALCAHPDSGLMGIITSPTAGGVMARRLLLAPVLIPLTTGLLKGVGLRTGIYNNEFASWLFAFLNLLIFTGAIWWSASLLYRAEIVRRQAEDDVHKLNAELERRVKERTVELDRTRTELQLIFDTVPALIFFKDRQHRHGRVNQGLVRFLGVAKEAIEGRTAKDMGAPHAERYYRDDDEVMTTGRAKRGIVEPVETASGTRWLQTDKFPTRDETGRITGLIGFALDITERKQVEEALRARDLAEAANRLKSEFLANMSHELRTPLNGIIGFAEFLADGKPGPLNPKQKEYLNDILNSGRHLLQLINDVLDLSKVEAGRMELNAETFSLPKAIEEVCAVAKAIAQKKRLVLQTHISDELDGVTLDQPKFKQVIYNLLSNAVKFTNEGGRVEVLACRVSAQRFRVAVRDTGIGIRQADVSRLFKEFQQLEAGAARRFEGTGLGLALTRKIVEALGGSIDVESELGKGSTFNVLLPTIPAPQHHEEVLYSCGG